MQTSNKNKLLSFMTYKIYNDPSRVPLFCAAIKIFKPSPGFSVLPSKYQARPLMV